MLEHWAKQTSNEGETFNVQRPTSNVQGLKGRLSASIEQGTARSTLVSSPRRFEQEPGSTLGLIDPDFDQARSRDIAMLVANIMRLAQTRGENAVVVL